MDKSAALRRALASYVPEALAITGTPGVALAVASAAGIEFVEGYGVADLATGRQMEPTAFFRVGSMSKLYIAVAVMQLVEQGRFALHDPVRLHISDVEVVNPLGARDITVHDLLTHQSGLGTDTFEPTAAPVPALATYLAVAYQSQRAREYGGVRARWTAPVGDRYQYSSLGSATLAQLVSVTNPWHLSYEGYVKAAIFDPLGLGDTYVSDGSDAGLAERHRAAMGYARFGQWCVPTPQLCTGVPPAAGVITTAADHARFLSALLGPAMYGTRTILTAESVAAMIKPAICGHSPGEAAGLFTGLGVEMRKLGAADAYFGHGGAYPFGWWGDSRAYPVLDLVVVGLSNVWDMTRFHNPLGRIAPALIADLVADSANPSTRPDHASKPQLHDAAYAMGLVMAERLSLFLGLPELVSPGSVDAMISGARTLTGAGDAPEWDPARFRAGVAAIQSWGDRPEAIAAFMRSSRCEVSPAQLRLHALAFGASRADFPVPVQFWATAETHATDDELPEWRPAQQPGK